MCDSKYSCDIGLKSAGAMLKMVWQPDIPRADIRIAALAQATKTLAVNWGLESRVSLYSMV